MLVKAGLIDEMQLNSALSVQRQWGGKLGDILVDQGFLDEDMLWLGLSRQLGLPLVSLADAQPPSELFYLVSAEMCDRLEIFPLARDERTITIATSAPNNVGALDEVAFRTGLKVKTVIAPQRELAWAIRKFYRGERTDCPPPRQRKVVATPDPPAPVGKTKLDITQAPASLPPTSASTPLGEIAGARAKTGTFAGIAPPQGYSTPPSVSPEEQLRQANEMLYALIELCVQRGVFTREELWARLAQTR